MDYLYDFSLTNTLKDQFKDKFFNLMSAGLQGACTQPLTAARNQNSSDVQYRNGEKNFEIIKDFTFILKTDK